MRDSPPKVVDGIVREEVNQWIDLVPFTRYFANDMGFIFRGQADSEWKLETTMQRFLHKQDVRLRNDSVFTKQLSDFRGAIRGLGIDVQNTSDNELWALGQHHGLYTPLLDWSFSFYIALFFAFSSAQPSSNGYRTVYALHKKGIGQKLDDFNANKAESQKFSIFESVSSNSRLLRQAGLFTKFPLYFDLLSWISTMYEGSFTPYIFIINISEEGRMRILKELNLMNINSQTLFPDLIGASMMCNESLMFINDKVKSFGSEGF